LSLQIQAWAEAAGDEGAGERLLFARIDEALARSRARQDEMVLLVGKLRETLDVLRARAEGLPEPERARWRRWLADAAETVNQARPHDDTASLRSLLVELRDGESALRSRQPVPPSTDAEWAGMRAEARRWLDRALDLSRVLPSDAESHMRRRLERLQRQFSEVMEVRDLRAARVLLLHLEDAVEDIRHALAGTEGAATLVDAPAPDRRPE